MDINCGMELHFAETENLEDQDFVSQNEGISDKLDLGTSSDDVQHLLVLDQVSSPSQSCHHDNSDKHLSAADFKLDLGPANDLVSASDFPISVSEMSAEPEENSEGYSIVNAALEGTTDQKQMPMSRANISTIPSLPLTSILPSLQPVQVIPMGSLQNLQLLATSKGNMVTVGTPTHQVINAKSNMSNNSTTDQFKDTNIFCPILDGQKLFSQPTMNQHKTLNVDSSNKVQFNTPVGQRVSSAVIVGNMLLLQPINGQLNNVLPKIPVSSITTNIPFVGNPFSQNVTMSTNSAIDTNSSFKCSKTTPASPVVTSAFSNQTVAGFTSSILQSMESLNSKDVCMAQDSNVAFEGVSSLKRNDHSQEVTGVKEEQPETTRTKIQIHGKTISMTFDCRNLKVMPGTKTVNTPQRNSPDPLLGTSACNQGAPAAALGVINTGVTQDIQLGPRIAPLTHDKKTPLESNSITVQGVNDGKFNVPMGSETKVQCFTSNLSSNNGKFVGNKIMDLKPSVTVLSDPNGAGIVQVISKDQNNDQTKYVSLLEQKNNTSGVPGAKLIVNNEDDDKNYITIDALQTNKQNLNRDGAETSDKETISSQAEENNLDEKTTTSPALISGPRNNIKCDLCSASFNRYGNYTRHRMIHTVNTKDDYRYKCQECGRLFLQRCDMKRHMLIHSNEQPFRCDICNKGYIRRSDLVIHLRFHKKEKKFKCMCCSKQFYQSGDLNRHVRNIHLPSTLLTCGHCSRQFAKEATLIRHMQTRHKDIIIKTLKNKDGTDSSDDTKPNEANDSVDGCFTEDQTKTGNMEVDSASTAENTSNFKEDSVNLNETISMTTMIDKDHDNSNETDNLIDINSIVNHKDSIEMN